MIWIGKSAQKVWDQASKYKWYLLLNLAAKAESEKEYLWNIFEHGKERFDIFVEDMTQTIYENYLGILGMMEMWVASQPRITGLFL
jgi:hypothetical protein